jgi:hypothetical protein
MITIFNVLHFKMQCVMGEVGPLNFFFLESTSKAYLFFIESRNLITKQLHIAAHNERRSNSTPCSSEDSHHRNYNSNAKEPILTRTPKLCLVPRWLALKNNDSD